MNSAYKVVNGKMVALSEAEKGHLKDAHEALASKAAADAMTNLARAKRKVEILEKLGITQDEWQLLLQGD